jgi:antibiotic biosynthesis monooxygenase (ABM) superfamily enzyme
VDWEDIREDLSAKPRCLTAKKPSVVGENLVATVRLVINCRVKPGRYADFLEGQKAFKKVAARLGANLVVSRQVAGPESGNVVVVVVFEDWAAYAKTQSDPELQGLLDAMRNNRDPAFDGYTASLNEEVAL